MKYSWYTRQGLARRKANGPQKGSQFNPNTGLPHTPKFIAMEREGGLRRPRTKVNGARRR